MGRKMGNPNELQVVNIRLVREPSLYSEQKIRTPEDAIKVIADELSTWDREAIAILTLKANGQPIALNFCSVGTLDSAVFSPREALKSVILNNANGVIMIHNHPGAYRAEVYPSDEDREVTRRMIQACDIIGIRFLDHLIVGSGDSGIYSFSSEGELDKLRHTMRQTDRGWER